MTAPAGAVDVTDALGPERARFLDLLRGLGPDDWTRPTECPAYDVQGVATHLLGDDLSLLSRQRDGAEPGIFSMWGEGDDFRTVLDRFNDRWVDAARFFSPAVLIDLLELTGRWTLDWYRTVDLDSLGEPVGFFAATGPSPYWQIAAREYVERWVHQHQIRRAVGAPDVDDDLLLTTAVAVANRAFAGHLHDCGCGDGDAVALVVDDLGAWTLQRAGGRWELLDGAVDDARVTVRMPRRAAAPLVSRGIPAGEVDALLAATGDPDIARAVVRGIAALTAR